MTQTHSESDLPQEESTPHQHSHGCGASCHADHGETQGIRRTSQPHRVIKIGRNDLCPCGSEKKYKKCCLGSKTL